MANRLKVCRKCMERLSVSEDASQDLGSYMVATGSGGIEIVDEEFCQYKLACGKNKASEIPPRSLADVTEVELDSAIANLLKQLNLHSYSQVGARELSSAIKAEWRKACEARKNAGSA
jgi:rRNA maturation endonuclease Nob1